MKNVISWSGGKDSTATIILAHELNIKIDLIIISLLWFDKKKKIYAEHPEHIEWIFNYAIPLFNSWGYEVKVLDDDRDFKYWFYHILTKSKDPNKNGKHKGWLIGGMCDFQKSKVQPIQKYLKTIGEYKEYVGIAADEKPRLERLHNKENKISLLEELKIREIEVWPICKKYNLLSPSYGISRRGGCWVCPNQSIKELAQLKTEHPELWQELQRLAATPNKATENFKYGKTFYEVEAEVESYLQAEAMQISLFDYMEGVIL